jgi:prepilin-type N-terminal cleavage/methylation domain-containing protein
VFIIKKLFIKKGFTLIEVIVGIALLGIIAISLIPLFTYGFIQINRAGNRTEAIYDNQSTIETNIPTNPIEQVFTIKFDEPGVELEIDVDVFEVEAEYDKNGNKTSIIFFKAK